MKAPGRVNEYESKYKDDDPSNTIDRIRQCLEKIGVSLVHDSFSQDVKDCYSLRVHMNAPLDCIGTNGKGTTQSFCLASGYAEFMERSQNKLFGLCGRDAPDFPLKSIREETEDFRMMSFDQLSADESGYVAWLRRQIEKSIQADSDGPSPDTLSRLLCKHYFPDRLPATPYYDVKNRRYVYMCSFFNQFFTKSNGMAAGNTLEEAIVQGLSEIFERASLMEILKNGYTPPDIPTDVLEAYPEIISVIRRIESDGRYKVLVKDASLGRGYPSVCGIIIDMVTKRFSVRFGAHPDVRIALERAFTESLQGTTLSRVTKNSFVSFSDTYNRSLLNVFNVMKTGEGAYGINLFGDTPSWDFIPWKWDPKAGNAALAVQMADLCVNEGHPVYIEDVSFLGFPSVYIIAQGMSEVSVDASTLKANILQEEVASIMRRCSGITEEEVRKILLLTQIMQGSSIDNSSIDNITYLKFSRRTYGLNKMVFLQALCFYYLGDIEKTIELFGRMKSEYCSLDLFEFHDETRYIATALVLLQGKAAHCDEKALLDGMRVLSGDQLTDQVWLDFSDPLLVFERFYPKCPNYSCPDCPHDDCRYPRIMDVYETLFAYQQKHSTARTGLHLLFSDGN